MLKHIGTFPFKLFNLDLSDLIPKMIEAKLVEFGPFMDNCAKTPSFLATIDRAKIAYEESCGA